MRMVYGSVVVHAGNDKNEFKCECGWVSERERKRERATDRERERLEAETDSRSGVPVMRENPVDSGTPGGDWI